MSGSEKDTANGKKTEHYRLKHTTISINAIFDGKMGKNVEYINNWHNIDLTMIWIFEACTASFSSFSLRVCLFVCVCNV